MKFYKHCAEFILKDTSKINSLRGHHPKLLITFQTDSNDYFEEYTGHYQSVQGDHAWEELKNELDYINLVQNKNYSIDNFILYNIYTTEYESKDIRSSHKSSLLIRSDNIESN